MTWENKELEAIPSESARQRIVGPDQLPEDGDAHAQQTLAQGLEERGGHDGEAAHDKAQCRSSRHRKRCDLLRKCLTRELLCADAHSYDV